jgi:hypothetical protein
MRKAVLGRSLLVAGLLCGAAGLQACNQSAVPPTAPLAALPPTTQPAPSLIPGPLADQLTSAPSPRLLQVSNPDEAYAFADRAYAMDAAFADSPPDYDFEDDGASPWVWVANDGSQCVAEYTPAGWRYYYYDPGQAEPFFIADPEYGYGYEGGALVVIYDHYGRAVPPGDVAQDHVAGQYLARAALLRTAAAHDPHRAVAASDWASQRTVITGQQRTWSIAQTSNPAWRAFHDQHAAEDAGHWNAERTRREAWAARVDANLGNPGRAQAEWRAAGQTATMADAGGAPDQSPRALARNTGGAPEFAGAGRPEPRFAQLNGPAGAPGREQRRQDLPGRQFAAQTPGPARGFQSQTLHSPRQVFAAQAPRDHAPHFAPGPRGGDAHAPSAQSFGIPASARVPEVTAHVAHGPPPSHFEAPHFEAPRSQTRQAPPQPQAHAAPPPHPDDRHRH